MPKGPFIYSKAESLDGKPSVFGGQCAGLVQWHTHAGKAVSWKEGVRVKGNGAKIKSGTAIATFVDGVYPNKDHGNHAALYLSQDSIGIWVVDQWIGKPVISKRRIRFIGKRADGSYLDPSNNGDAFSVIMHG